MTKLKALVLALFVIMALIFIGCGGVAAGVAGGDTNGNGYNNDNNQPG